MGWRVDIVRRIGWVLPFDSEDRSWPHHRIRIHHGLLRKKCVLLCWHNCLQNGPHLNRNTIISTFTIVRACLSESCKLW